jgi:hypothetical protein
VKWLTLQITLMILFLKVPEQTTFNQLGEYHASLSKAIGFSDKKILWEI